MANQANQAWRSWLMIALVAAAFFAMYRMNPTRPKVRDMTLLELYDAMDQGKLVEPVTRVFDRDAGETYLTGEVELDALDGKGSPLRERYRVTLVPGENEGTMADLLDGKVKVVVKEQRSAISPFVTQLLVFFGFMALFYWLFYRRMGGGVFGMGKSKAKLLDGKEDKRASITFADVAGVDEAKEEVQEIGRASCRERV